MKSGKKLSEKLLSVLLIHLTELHVYFLDLFASLISVESENRYFGSLLEYRAKGNILRQQRERSFLGNFFVFCEIISQSYSFPLKNSFAKTVLVELAKWYLDAHRELWWKRKYASMKSGKKLSEKLTCDVWLPLTELPLYFVDVFASLISVESENRYFGYLGRL